MQLFFFYGLYLSLQYSPVGSESEVTHTSIKHLCSATETSRYRWSRQAHSATSDPEAHGTEQSPSPAGPAESRKPTLGRYDEGGSGRQARVQTHTAQGNHQAAEEATEGAAGANSAADREAEH